MYVFIYRPPYGSTWTETCSGNETDLLHVVHSRTPSSLCASSHLLLFSSSTTKIKSAENEEGAE
jgi:hypothetical protein